MSRKNGKFKNKGNNSKKVARQISAKIRREEFGKLSPQGKQEQKARNKAEYDASR